MIERKAIVISFKVLPRYLPGVTEAYQNPQSTQSTSQPKLEAFPPWTQTRKNNNYVGSLLDWTLCRTTATNSVKQFTSLRGGFRVLQNKVTIGPGSSGTVPKIVLISRTDFILDLDVVVFFLFFRFYSVFLAIFFKMDSLLLVTFQTIR
jgi:hypothetical protein